MKETKETVEQLPARERILKVASDLFYKQGYRATGVNEIIKQAGVAKATFFAHFPTKDDLCLAYLKDRNQMEVTEFSAIIKSKKTPRERFLTYIESLEPWLVESNMRGCHLLNTIAEVPDPNHPLRVEGVQHYEYIRSSVFQFAQELIASDKNAYGHLDAKDLTDTYMLIFTGAIALAEIYHDIWPVQQAKHLIEQLISRSR